MKTITFAFPTPETNDILHEDGSKSYQLFHGEYIKIDRPIVVDFIEGILNEDHAGWSYMKKIQEAYDTDFLTKGEYEKIITILD